MCKRIWLQYTFVKNKFFLGISPTPEILAIVTIYFVEGAIGLAGLAQTFLLKDELLLGPAEMSALSGLFVLPWTIKPIYGFLSDAFPFFGYRRRSYLFLGGIFGSLLSTPILNAPQTAILGMHKIQDRPVAENGQVVIRPMMYLALSYDHRMIDGKEAVQFLVTIKELLQDPARILLEI